MDFFIFFVDFFIFFGNFVDFFIFFGIFLFFSWIFLFFLVTSWIFLFFLRFFIFLGVRGFLFFLVTSVVLFNIGPVTVCVYYCRTYYKSVRVGEEDSGGHVL